MEIVKMTPETAHNKFSDLTRELAEASEAYYGGNSIMSDHEFDRKAEELRKLETINGFAYDISPTIKVGATVVKELQKARHEQPALSLDKVKYKSRENLKKWLENRQAVMSWKCDGSTVVVTYDGGRLTSAVTRGNGEEGSVITHNARFFKGLPEKIDYLGHLVVRGEAMMTNAEFERVNAEAGGIYENARNLATATIQMLDAGESSKREIIFKAFELVSPEPQNERIMPDGTLNAVGETNIAYMGDRLNWLGSLGFDVVDHEYCDDSDILSKIEEWKADVTNLDYPTDGLVISYNNLKDGWALGSTGHHPRWAMALKWSDDTAETTIKDIEWSVGKTGVITPVAVFDTVRLGLGSNVTRASLHNLSIMENMPVTGMDFTGPLAIGSKAEVYLANMIIPQVASYTSMTGKEQEIEIPKICPICGAPTEIRDKGGVKTLYCTNHDGCPAQQIGKLMNTFGKDGLFVKGLGESQIKDLIESGLVKDTLDFYTLDRRVAVGGTEQGQVGRLLMKEGWGSKKWENLLDAIDASRNTTLQRFLYSLNIPLLGNDLSKKLAKYWHEDIEWFLTFLCGVDEAAGKDEYFGYNRALDELTAIDGVGDEKAKNIVDWAHKLAEDGDAYHRLIKLVEELHFPDTRTTEPANQELSGLTFVITGSVNTYKNRDEFKASVEARGGKVAGSVSKNTTVLVNNDVTSTSGKNQKAKELGIEIISEDEFISRYGK